MAQSMACAPPEYTGVIKNLQVMKGDKLQILKETLKAYWRLKYNLARVGREEEKL